MMTRRQLALEILPSTPPRLEDFVVGSNQEAVDILARWAAGREKERFIYLWGPHGVGKTHLLRALAPDAFISCTPSTRFHATPQPVQAVDDVHRLDRDGALSLFHRFNEKREDGSRLLVSGVHPPAKLDLPPELATRLGWGLVLRLHALEDEQKILALQSRALRLGARLPADAARYLMTHCNRDTGYLFHFLHELNRWSLAAHRDTLSIPLIREVLEASSPPPLPH